MPSICWTNFHWLDFFFPPNLLCHSPFHHQRAVYQISWWHHLSAPSSYSTPIVWAFRVVFSMISVVGGFQNSSQWSPSADTSALVESSPLSLAGLCALLSMNRWWQMWWDVLVRLGYKWLTSGLLTFSPRLFLGGSRWRAELPRYELLYGEVCSSRVRGLPPANSQ